MNHPFEDLRSYYLACFESSLERAQDEFDTVATEVLLELPMPDEPEICYRVFRADIVGRICGKTKMREVNVANRSVSAAIAAPRATINLINPMIWNDLHFRVQGARVAELQLQEWMRYWLDVDHQRHNDVQVFQSVVHYVSRPLISKDGFEFSVDFGSAPTVALDAILRILSDGSQVVTVGSFDLAEPTHGVSECDDRSMIAD
jgi:hypothetical protein